MFWNLTPEDGGYVVYCPALPGCYSQGDTREEALHNIKEAIEAYIESLKKEKLPVPTGPEPEILSVRADQGGSVDRVVRLRSVRGQ